MATEHHNPPPVGLTLEEQERWAYAEGDTELAAELARQIDEQKGEQ